MKDFAIADVSGLLHLHIGLENATKQWWSAIQDGIQDRMNDVTRTAMRHRIADIV